MSHALFGLVTKSKKVILRNYYTYNPLDIRDMMVINFKDRVEPDMQLFKAVNMNESLVTIICMTSRKCLVVKASLMESQN